MDLATLEDFAHINPASIMAMSNSLHFHTLEYAFKKAAQTAENAGDAAACKAYNVLAVVCSYHFNPSRPDTFSPQIIFKGKRTLIPSDYLGEQRRLTCKLFRRLSAAPSRSNTSLVIGNEIAGPFECERVSNRVHLRRI
ncbi:DUF7380 domain-containing protein [Pseudomonas kulmbachensis]|uniref:DUF7380 domain-containing protein n=1 Tax=Pseudomonas kulmbachensis TaxID=3043408 RepID=UPI002AB0BEAF|nr:hypothetical protein [Pseudomonas sp. V3/3/4/13]